MDNRAQAQHPMIPPLSKAQLRQIQGVAATVDNLPKDLSTTAAQMARDGGLGVAATVASTPDYALGLEPYGAIKRELDTSAVWTSVTSDDFSATGAVARAVQDANRFLPAPLSDSFNVAMARQRHTDVYLSPVDIALKDLDLVSDAAHRVIDTHSIALEQIRLTIDSFADFQVDELVALATTSLANNIALRSWAIPIPSEPETSEERATFEQEIREEYPDTSAEVVSVYTRLRAMCASPIVSNTCALFVVLLMLENRFNPQATATTGDAQVDVHISVDVQVEASKSPPQTMQIQTVEMERLLREIRDAVTSEQTQQTHDHDSHDSEPSDAGTPR